MLVAIEGIDAAGKNTQTDMLVSRATEHGLSAVAVSFPRYRETFFGGQIRQLLSGDFGSDNDPRLIGLLFAGDRFQSLPVILDALATHDLVVADRYVASNLAYQSARGMSSSRQEIIEWLTEVEYGVFGLPHPDLHVLLDVPVDVASDRLSTRVEQDGRVSGDLFETDLEYLARCREAYAFLAEHESGWATVPVTRGQRVLSADQIAEQVWNAVAEQLEVESNLSVIRCVI